MKILEKWQEMPVGAKKAVVALLAECGIDIDEILSPSASGGDTAELESAWLRLYQAAAIANCSTYTVRRWCEKGLIKWRKLNKARCGRILINRASLMSFIDECCVKEA